MMLFFYSEAMEYDIPFLRRQLAERRIGSHTHLPGNVLHQRPHQCLTRGHRPLVDGQQLVRHQSGLIHYAYTPAPSQAGQAFWLLKASSSVPEV